MKLTIKKLTKLDACLKGIEWYKEQKVTDFFEIMKRLIKEKKLDWANWIIVRVMKYNQYVKYAIYAAEQVIDIYEKKYPDDNRPRKAIVSAKKCLKNKSKKNIVAAAAAAAAANAANAAYAAAAYDDAAAAAYAANAAYAAAYDDAAANAAYAAAAYDDAAAAVANAAYAADIRYKMKLKIINYGIKLLKK